MSRTLTLRWVAAGLFAAGVAVFFRLYPVTVYPLYAAKSGAELLVYSNIRKAAEAKTRGAFPQDAPAKQKETIEREFRKFLLLEKKKIRELIDLTAKKILLEKRNRPYYLLEADPYYYLRLTRNILETGSMAKKIDGHKYFNDRMMAPNGSWYPADYHPYTGFFTHKILKIFKKNISLMESCAWAPVFLALLCVGAFLFLSAKVFGISPLPASLAAVYFALMPMFLKRSLLGWYDTDPHNVLFPCLISLALSFSLAAGNRTKKIYALFIAISFTAVYSLFWRGFFLMFGVLAGSFLFGAAFSSKRKESLAWAFLYTLSPALFFPLFWGTAGFTDALRESAGFFSGFFHPSFSLWPDVFLSVGELRPSSFFSMCELKGGVFLYLFSFLSLFAEWAKPQNKSARGGALFWLIFFVLTSLLGLSFERFIILMTVPAAAGLALGLKRIFIFLNARPALWRRAAKSALTAATLSAFFIGAHQTARYEHPIYNSSWDKMMRVLNEKTPPDSIVTSWWSPGHFITSMADRRVTFDGATQNTPRAYWVSNLFLTDSEEKALGILRMLNSGSDPGGELTQKIPLSKAVDTVWKNLPRLAGRPIPPSYVFIYDNLVESALAMEYIGNWDFSKAESFNVLLKKYPHLVPKKVLKRASKENVQLAWGIAGGPWAQDKESYEEGRDDGFIYFTNGLKLRKDFSQAELQSKKFGSGLIKSVFYMENGELKEKKAASHGLNLSALVIKEKTAGREIYKTVLADERLIRSILFRLFYLNGEGLKHFKPFAKEESIENRNRFYIYEVKD